MIFWGAANARARGLATHLLRRDVLVHAAEARTWPDAFGTIVAAGYPLEPEGRVATAAEFDRRVGQVLAERLALLGRWLGRQRAALAVVYEDAELHSLRRLLRGSVQGTSPSLRREGAVPTPTLTDRALQRLAQASSPEDLTDALICIGHPAGRVLQDVLRNATGVALGGAEAALGRLFAQRATRAARAGGKAIRGFAAMQVDLTNAEALLLRRDWGPEGAADEVFLPGGAILDRSGFAAIAREVPDRIWPALTERYAGTPLAAVFEGASPAADLEARALGAMLTWQRGEARRDPSGPGPVLEVIVRMRAEARDLRALRHALELGAPAGVATQDLVTPA